MGWFRAFIEGGGEHAVPRETQEQQEARLSKQRERSAQNRAVRTSQQRSICREQERVRRRLRRSYVDETEKMGRLEVRLAELSPRGNHVWVGETADQHFDRMRKDASSKRLSRGSKRGEEEMFKEMDEAKMQLYHIGLRQDEVREEIDENEALLRHLQICSSCLALTSSSSQPPGGMKLAKWQSKIRYQCSQPILRRLRDKPWCCTCIGEIETCITYLKKCMEELSDLDEEALSVGRRFPMAATL